MNTIEKQNNTVLENRENRNQNQDIIDENVTNEQFYGIDEVKNQHDNSSEKYIEASIYPDPEQITNDEEDYFDDEGIEDQDDEVLEIEELEDEIENSIDKPSEDFNETENDIEDPDFNEEEENEDEVEEIDTNYNADFPVNHHLNIF